MASEDVVDLVIERKADKEDKPGTRVAQPAGGGGQVGVITCDVFPNRTTEYAFALKNLSRKQRKVAVQFWPAPEGPISDRPGAGGPDKPFQPGPARPLTGEIEIELPANETPKAIALAEPKPGEKPEPGKKEGPEGAKSPAEKPKDAGEKPEPGKEGRPPGPDISHGIACVIRDLAAGTKWTRWVRLERQKPTAYLDPKVSYDGAKIQVRINAVADPRYRPLVSAEPEQAIRVDWETAPGAGGEAGGKPLRARAVLTSPDAEDILVAEVPPATDRVVPLSLTVDGYPRAFVYSVPCDRRREDVPANADADLREIRILSPKGEAAFASPLTNDAPLWVEFQVDAPRDAFRPPGESVEAWLDVKGDPALAARTRQSFASDRQWVVRWEGMTAQGVVKIDAKAHDFRVPLDTLRTSETKVDVRVRLALPGHQGVKVKDAKVTVVLDGEAPKIVRYVPPPGPVAKGADIPVSLELSDLSGIDRVLFGFVKNEAALLDEKRSWRKSPPPIWRKKRVGIRRPHQGGQARADPRPEVPPGGAGVGPGRPLQPGGEADHDREDGGRAQGRGDDGDDRRAGLL